MNGGAPAARSLHAPVHDRSVKASPGTQATSTRAITWLLLTLVCLGWTAIAGKDLNWDQINYHFYSGFSAIHDRFDQDLLPASVQSYLVPYAHAPFYLLASSGWPALAVGLALALLHSSCLWMLYETARLLPRPPGTPGRVQAALGLTLGALSPIFLAQVGSSFSDIVTCAPMMAAIAVLARLHHVAPGVTVPTEAEATSASRAMVLAGLFAGWAVGWKATNLAFAVAAAALILVRPVGWSRRVKETAVYAMAGGAGVAIAGGPWMWRVWREFGSPIFPLFNDLFRSPWFDPVPIALDRFIPKDTADLLLAPFRMAMPRSFVHFENPTVDLRPAVLMILACVAIAAMTVARGAWRRRAARIAVQEDRHLETGRLLVASIVMFVLGWLVWSRTSGNGRYMLPLTLLAGPLVAASIWRLTASPRASVYATAALVCLQAAVVGLGSQWRWNDAPWGGAWYKLDVPAALAREPALFVAIDTQTASFLVPWLHPQSSYVALDSQYPLMPGAPLAERFERLRARHPQTWVVGEVLAFRSGSGPMLPVESVDRSLVRFGLKLAPAGCRTIRVEDRLSLVIRIEEKEGVAAGATPASAFFACPAVAAPGWSDADRASKSRVEQALARAEQRCPALFRPAGTPLIGTAAEWRRFYINSDLYVTVAGERITLEGWQRARATLPDTVADWQSGRFPHGCPQLRRSVGD